MKNDILGQKWTWQREWKSDISDDQWMWTDVKTHVNELWGKIHLARERWNFSEKWHEKALKSDNHCDRCRRHDDDIIRHVIGHVFGHTKRSQNLRHRDKVIFWSEWDCRQMPLTLESTAKWTSENSTIGAMDVRCPRNTHLTLICHTVIALNCPKLAFNTDSKNRRKTSENRHFLWMTAWQCSWMTFTNCTERWQHFNGFHVSQWMKRDAKIRCLMQCSHWSSKIACGIDIQVSNHWHWSWHWSWMPKNRPTRNSFFPHL